MGTYTIVFSFILFLYVKTAFATDNCFCGAIWTQETGGPFTLPYAINVTEYFPTKTDSQAKWHCMARPLTCDGFLFQSGALKSWFFTYKLPLTSVIGASNFGAMTSVNVSVAYDMDRWRHYRCTPTDSTTVPVAQNTFDPYDYYFTLYRSRVNAFICPYYNGTGCCWSTDAGACTSNPTPTRTQALTASNTTWVTIARRHFNEIGHLIPLNPNANCVVTPLLWSDAACAVPTRGCDTFGSNDYPCSENGYCIANPNNRTGFYVTPYQCDCFNYTGGLFGNIFKYMGNACQFPTRDFCTTNVNDATMCSGYNNRCRPTPTNNPNNDLDYHPACMCDTEGPLANGTWPAITTPVNTEGDFCEIDRCDPVNHCQVLGGSAGTCTLVGSTWRCVCSQDAVGSLCQYSTQVCRYQSESSNCHSSGVCIAPGQSAPNSNMTITNFNLTSPWCSCLTNRSYGAQCQLLHCDPLAVTEGHGNCDPLTGSFISCYTPMYQSSSLPNTKLCDIDRCALFGGSVIGNPPSDCACGNYIHISQGCYPRCADYLGTQCGPGSGLEVNTCVQTANGGDTIRYSNCLCGNGFLPIPANVTQYMNPPPSTTAIYCEKYCIHGDIDEDTWTVSHPTACVCPNTGYLTVDPVTSTLYPRCNFAKCRNGGTWNTTSQSCICPPPFTSVSDCRESLCDPTATTYHEGTAIPNVQRPGNYSCACIPPFFPSTTANLDCAINHCVAPATLNTSFTNTSTAQQMCVCPAFRRTPVCTDATKRSCEICIGLCEHGGTLRSGSNTSCDCIFPFVADSLCHGDVCGLNGVASAATNSCICTNGFTGRNCTVSPCSVNSTWDQDELACICLPDVPVVNCTVLNTTESSSSISSSGGDTGLSSNDSSSLSDSFSSTSPGAAAAAADPFTSTGAIVGYTVGGAAVVGASAFAAWWLTTSPVIPRVTSYMPVSRVVT